MFAPYLPAAVTELVKLAEEADTLESKHRVARCLDTIIEKAEIRVCVILSLHTLCHVVFLDYTIHSHNYLGPTPILQVYSALFIANQVMVCSALIEYPAKPDCTV